MTDIAPELINSIKETFNDLLKKDGAYAKLLEKVNSGKATYSEAHKIAIRIGDDLAKSYKLKISSDVLPDGKMYYNIAERLIYETMEKPHKLIADACEAVQNDINSAARIGMKAVVPEQNVSRLDGLIERLSSGELFDDIDWVLDDPIINVMQSEVDDFVKENARVQNEAGLNPKIVRVAVGRACKWCSNLAGTYNYDQVSNTGNDVFRRHENCRCLTEYVADGRRQNVWTKINKDDYLEQISKAYKVDTSNKEKLLLPSKNKYGEEIKFDLPDKMIEQERLLKSLANEYNTRLQTVSIGAKQAAGSVDISGATLKINTNNPTDAIHEFAHTLANKRAEKYKLTNDADFWKEISKINREYMKNVGDNVQLWISSYEHSSRNIDEFFAEAFAMAKAAEKGYNIPTKYGKDLTYANKVLKVVDKYFKRY